MQDSNLFCNAYMNLKTMIYWLQIDTNRDEIMTS